MDSPTENTVDQYHISKDDLLGLLRKLFPKFLDKQFGVKVTTSRVVYTIICIGITDRFPE